MRADDQGRPTGGEVYTRGGGGGANTPPPKMCAIFFGKINLIFKKNSFSSGIFFQHFSWGVRNTSRFGMQLCFGVRSDRY